MRWDVVSVPALITMLSFCITLLCRALICFCACNEDFSLILEVVLYAEVFAVLP